MLAPEIVDQIGAWIHPVSLATGAALPNLRALIRRVRQADPCYVRQYVVHDAMSGFAFPSFLVLCALPIAPTLLSKLQTEHLVLAGVLGIVFVVSEVVSAEDDE